MTIGQLQGDPIKQYALKVAQVESGNNPKAKNPYSSAGGLFQFTQSTWQGVSDRYNLGYTAEDRFNPNKAQKAFELFTKDNEKAIQPILGRELTDADRYMTHFLGAGGAGKFFKVYQQNPNAPISSVFSPQVIAANKNVALNKDGSQKTLSEVYNWAQNKMNITPTNVTQEFTDYDNKTSVPKFATNSVQLVSAPDIKEEDSAVKEVQKELDQKTKEYNFIQDYLAKQQQRLQPQQQEIPLPQEELPQTNILEQYAQISQFVENPILQQGGIIEDNMGQWKYPGQITKINSPDITMQGVNYPVLGIADTGEQKMMMPNLNYYFNGAKSVTEIPLI